MKKKMLGILITIMLIITITGCNNTTPNRVDSGTENNVDNNNKVDNKVTNSEDKVLKNENEEKYKTINFNEKIELDFVEITLEGASSGKEIRPDNPKNVYRYSPEQEGKTYFYVYGTIKNVGGEKYEFADNMYVSFSFDEKYKYNGSVTADEGGDFSYIYAYLDPLESEKFYLTVSVPDELINQYKNVELKFGFKNNFEYEYGIQENECDNLYSIKISK